ncbi:MAG: hypothetical protein JNL57_08155 [Bacteroidetes bacterium]|nr:hypothetical protein [Bacteroidota bacterium]
MHLGAQPFKQSYKAALILPFKSGGNHGQLGEAILDYYEGFKMALKDLENEGLKMQLYVFDSEKDSLAMDEILLHPDLGKMDLIIGPVSEKGMAKLDVFCQEKNIVLISPLKYYKPHTGGAKIFNFFIPDSLRVAASAKAVYELYPKHRYYLLTDNSAKSKENAAILKRLKWIPWKTVNLVNGRPTPAIARTDSVIVVTTIPLSSAKSGLLAAVKGKKNSWALGFHDWYPEIESFYKINEPQLLYPAVNYINESDTAVVDFENRFTENYEGEPSKYAFQGYDQALWLGYSLMTWGPDFYLHNPDAANHGLINVIHMQQEKNGYLNAGINLVRILDGESTAFKP